jgi:very-short-patch-repair endonuclease
MIKPRLDGLAMKFLHNDPALKDYRRALRRNQTDAEKALWSHLRNRQFYGMRFFRQYSLGPYILDFYCPEIKIAIELDGGQHNEPEGKIYDTARSEYLQVQKIEVLRFWDNDVFQNIEGVLARMEQKCNPSRPPLMIRGGERKILSEGKKDHEV